MIYFLACFATSFLGILYFRRWVQTKELLDIPNERSSHERPTPRGGGAVIVIICIVSYLFISWFNPATFSWGYLAGAVLIAGISWLDDLYSLWFVWRFTAHAIAAIIVIVDFGYWQNVYLPFASITFNLGRFGLLITFLWITWLVNAYNFMDGIDGIAGTQSVIAAASWLALGYFYEIPFIYYFSGVIVASSMGFLLHNWQPAKIFMGDVGSSFLGFTFAVMPLLARKHIGEMTYALEFAAILFLWFFIFDSVITFFHRLYRGVNVFSAHREHIYQKLVVSGMSHERVTIIYGVLTLILSLSTVAILVSFNEMGIIVLPALTIILTLVLLAIYASRQPK